jgi:hypothetical protein
MLDRLFDMMPFDIAQLVELKLTEVYELQTHRSVVRNWLEGLLLFLSRHGYSWKKFSSPSGNRTRAFHVTGGDPYH